MKITKTIIITGTHHTPAIEIIKQLQNDTTISWKIHYISHTTPSDTHLSKIIIPQLQSNYHNISCGKFHRRSLLDTIIGIPYIIFGFFQALLLIKFIKPDLVVSFGGYVSVPVIIASYIYKIPSITHEQTLTVSLATRINALFSTKIALTFEETNSQKLLPKNKIIVTGNPIRTEIFKQTSPKYSYLKSKIQKQPLIYITGGSRGSEFINQLIVNSLPFLSKFTVIHQTGTNDLKSVLVQTKSKKYPNYFPTDYVDYDNIGWVLNNAEIVIGRSGANNCLDLYVLNKKSILIPLPFAQQNEQLLNAQWLQNKYPNQTVIYSQSELTPEKLIKSISKLNQLKISTKQLTPPVSHPLFNLIHDFT